jgi:hypothetical protein
VARIVWFLPVNHAVFVYCYSLSTLLTNEQLADEQKMEQKNVLKKTINEWTGERMDG